MPSFFHLLWGKLKSPSRHFLELFFVADDKTACIFLLNKDLFWRFIYTDKSNVTVLVQCDVNCQDFTCH